METFDLYDIAENENIPIELMPLSSCVSLTVQLDSGRRCLALNPRAIHSSAEEKTCLAHELGHCCTGSLYMRTSPLRVIGKAEYQADKWAVRNLIPFDQLQYAVRTLAIKKPYELADYFGVTEPLIHRAFDIYKRMGEVV